MTDDVIVRVFRLSPNVVGVELYVWCPDSTVEWLPSLHNGSIDVTVIDAQIREHHART